MTPVPWQNLSMIMIPSGQRLSLPIKKTIHNWPKFCFWILWRGDKRKEERISALGRRQEGRRKTSLTPNLEKRQTPRRSEMQRDPLHERRGNRELYIGLRHPGLFFYIQTANVESFHNRKPEIRFLAYSSNV